MRLPFILCYCGAGRHSAVHSGPTLDFYARLRRRHGLAEFMGASCQGHCLAHVLS